MRMYFALSTDVKGNDPLFRTRAKYFLYSYHYYNTKGKIKMLDETGVFDSKAPFLDSGAFSAHTLGKVIDLDKYISYIKTTGIQLYANLDDITNPDQTIKNEAYMRERGLNPIPVFHTGEEIKYLDRILEYADYMALGGMVMAPDLDYWLRNAWTHIMKRRPDIKVHGFGLTNPNYIIKYPWYSVDSSAWVTCVRFARFSEWQDDAHIFNTKMIQDIYKRYLGLEYNPGDKIIGDPRYDLIEHQVERFLKMNDWINEGHATKDFSYLTAQGDLFE